MTGLKVMVLTTAFARAAPVRGAFLFARWLHEQGIGVTFAALDEKPNDLLGDIQASGVPTHCFALNGWLGVRRRSSVQRFVVQRGIHVVLSDGLRPDIVGAGLQGVTRVSNVRGVLSEHYALDFPLGVAQVVTRVQARALRKMDGVFAISPEIAEHLIGLGVRHERSHVVDNFVDVEEVRAASEGGPDLGHGVHVGAFASLIKRKRFDVALRGFASLVRVHHHYDAILHVAGAGPLRKRLEALAERLDIKGHVQFHGFVDQPLPLMRKMDVVLLTSDREGVPRSLMEAMALGRTCVSSAFPGIDSLIEDGATGYVFPQGDVDALGLALHNAIQPAGAIPESLLLAYMRARHDVHACAPKMWEEIQRIAAR